MDLRFPRGARHKLHRHDGRTQADWMTSLTPGEVVAVPLVLAYTIAVRVGVGRRFAGRGLLLG